MSVTPGFQPRATTYDVAGMVTLNDAVGVLLQERRLVRGQPMPQLQPFADDPTGLLRHVGDGLPHAALASGRDCLWQLPFEADRRRGADVAVDRRGEVANPVVAAVLAVGQHVDADLALHVQRGQDGAVLDLLELLAARCAAG